MRTGCGRKRVRFRLLIFLDLVFFIYYGRDFKVKEGNWGMIELGKGWSWGKRKGLIRKVY